MRDTSPCGSHLSAATSSSGFKTTCQARPQRVRRAGAEDDADEKAEYLLGIVIQKHCPDMRSLTFSPPVFVYLPIPYRGDVDNGPNVSLPELHAHLLVQRTMHG